MIIYNSCTIDYIYLKFGQLNLKAFATLPCKPWGHLYQSVTDGNLKLGGVEPEAKQDVWLHFIRVHGKMKHLRPLKNFQSPPLKETAANWKNPRAEWDVKSTTLIPTLKPLDPLSGRAPPLSHSLLTALTRGCGSCFSSAHSGTVNGCNCWWSAAAAALLSRSSHLQTAAWGC